MKFKGKTYDSIDDLRNELDREWREKPVCKRVYIRVKRKLTSALDFLRYDIPQGIKSLIKWLPIIWKDRDWDEHYLLRIMAFKMRNMSRLHKYHGHTEDHLETAEELRRAAELANDLAEDNWHMPFNQEKKKRELFDLMSDKINGWWD